MNTAFSRLVEQMHTAFSHPRVYERAKALIFSSLLCLGRHTITGLLSTCGQQFVDWSAAYRIFERRRFDPQRLFDVPLRATVAHLPAGQPVIAFLDDTLLHKSGRHVHGASWKRDPLGPPFSTNLVWSQRFLQISLALPEQPLGVPGRARAIPVDFSHCPTARKPSAKASHETWDAFHALRASQKLSVRGVTQIQALRDRLDQDPQTRDRVLLTCCDGSFTNRKMLAPLPHHTALIGRIRKDACLYALPAEEHRHGRGRKRSYGAQLPTPEQIRQDPAIPWKTVRVFAAGRYFDVRIKSIAPVLWRPAGAKREMRLIIIEPLAYRPRAGAKLLYRDPGYLVCTDITLDDQDIVQWFLWRWEIEMNFRDEKTLLGVGEAQVRTLEAVEAVPQLQVAAYACLLLAEQQVRNTLQTLPKPRWRRGHRERVPRCTTAEMIATLRAEVWADSLGGMNFPGFDDNHANNTKPKKIENTLKDAVCYAIN